MRELTQEMYTNLYKICSLMIECQFLEPDRNGVGRFQQAVIPFGAESNGVSDGLD